MFKKVLQSLSKSLNRQQTGPLPAKTEGAKREVIGSVVSQPKPSAASPATKAEPAPVKETPRTPEELCGINPKMNKEQIRDHLKMLYRRFNQSASSLDPKTRGEADTMLDAIVAVREKHFGQI